MTLTPIGSGLSLPGGVAADAVRARIAALERADFERRLWAKDDALWGEGDDRRAVARTRLGWLDAPQRMQERIGELRAFASEVAADGLTHVVLLGMGGSSLAPEVMRRAFGVARGALELTVLDNTSPAAVRAVADAHDPARTLFLVSSKSGGTIEVASFEKHFFARAEAALGGHAGRHFAAITDPGSPLLDLARRRGYRRTFENDPNIGGRYSALSYFGLVPAALIGADLDRLLASAHAEAARCRRHGAENPALVLGAALGELARTGRDKVTFVLEGAYAPLGVWIEQLIAESTGKDGRGIVPVVDEPLGEPDDYAHDRVFVAFGAAPPAAATGARLDALESLGHPVFRWVDGDGGALGGEFLGWEFVTAVAGAVIDVNPFDEPNVTEAKKATAEVLDAFVTDGAFPDEPAGPADEVAITGFSKALADQVGMPTGGESGSWIAAVLDTAASGDYVALLAYMRQTPERHERLQRLRLAARRRTRSATTLGYGPRFLHSTGQLHKGGAANGVFIQLTCDEGDTPIPGERYGFEALRRAQAIGDFQVLSRRGRRALRVHLGEHVERGLDRLIEALEG